MTIGIFFEPQELVGLIYVFKIPVHLPIIQTNGNKSVQLERTDNSDMLQMSTLRKTANAPKLVDANSRHNLKVIYMKQNVI